MIRINLICSVRTHILFYNKTVLKNFKKPINTKGEINKHYFC